MSALTKLTLSLGLVCLLSSSAYSAPQDNTAISAGAATCSRQGCDDFIRVLFPASSAYIAKPLAPPTVTTQTDAPLKTSKAQPERQLAVKDLNTTWGFGQRENKYNASILKAAQASWPHKELPLHPILLKSLIASESAFDPMAVSYTGAAGLAQLTPETARRFGLNWSTTRDPQYALPVGVKVLAEKAQAILDPSNYHKILGMTPQQCHFAACVAQSYKKYGYPSPQQLWPLVLASYNAGGGTVLRAMAYAHKKGLDPREWSVLVGDRNHPETSPLYHACRQIFGWNAYNKYLEISAYPGHILQRLDAPVIQGGTKPLG